MGINRLLSTLLNHPISKNSIFDKVPIFEFLLVDFNANIHYIYKKQSLN